MDLCQHAVVDIGTAIKCICLYFSFKYVNCINVFENVHSFNQ